MSLYGRTADKGDEEEMRITEFFDAMVEKLEANSHKGGWQDMSAPEILGRITEEMNELRCALRERRDKSCIVREAADVANFLFFLADNYTNDYEPRRKQKEIG